MAPPCSLIWFCLYPAIIHVAVTDIDATYDVYVAAEEVILLIPQIGFS